MKMSIVVNEKPMTIPSGYSVDKLLEVLGELPELTVVLVNEEPVTEDYRLKEGDQVEIVRAISGG